MLLLYKRDNPSAEDILSFVSFVTHTSPKVSCEFSFRKYILKFWLPVKKAVKCMQFLFEKLSNLDAHV